MPKEKTLEPVEPAQAKISNEQLASELAEMKGLLASLTAPKAPQSKYAERSREHFAGIREMIEYDDKENETPWLIQKIARITHNQRVEESDEPVSLCTVTLWNPRTGEEQKKRMQYLTVLRDTPVRTVKILSHKQEDVIKRMAGPRYHIAGGNEVLAEEHFLHEVKTTHMVYTVEVVDGAFAGTTFETDGTMLNI